MKRTCIICGKQFETTSSRQLTCSKQCSLKEHYIKEAERKKKRNPYRVCKMCGKQFVPISKEQFCSEECKEKSRKISMMNSKAKIIERKHASGEIKKRLTPEEKAIKNQKQKRYYNCVVCGKKFERHYNEIYCSDECRKRARCLYQQKSLQKRKQDKLTSKICPVCGKEFITTKAYKKYCSEECRLKVAQKIRADIFQRNHVVKYAKCPICGKEFPQTKHFMKYCSNECRNMARQQKVKPEYVEKTCIICGKTFWTKSRSTLCCSDKCHKKYRAQVQTEYQHKKMEPIRIEKMRLKAEKEKQLALQLQMKKKQKRDKKIGVIQGKVKFPKYMEEEILKYTNQNQYNVIFQFIQNRLAKKFDYVDDIDKDKIYAIVSQNSEDMIQQLENYLSELILTKQESKDLRG